MLRNLSFIGIIGLFFLISCEEPVDLDFKDQNQQVVLISEVAPNRPYEVYVTKTRSSISIADQEHVVNADIRIYEDGDMIDQLILARQESNEDGKPLIPFYRGRLAKPVFSGNYKIEVEVPGFGILTAEDMIPPVPAKTTSFTKTSLTEILGRPGSWYDLELSLKLKDISPEMFYHVILYEEYKTNYPSDNPSDSIYIIDSKIVNGEIDYLNHFEKGFLIKGSDLINHGNQLDFLAEFFYDRFGISLGFVSQEVVVELRTVSQDYFDYHSSLTRQLSQSDSIVAQPVVLFSNVKGGLGNFSAYNYHRDTILID